jgi:tetratricopeptide (TPR) repeat protein
LIMQILNNAKFWLSCLLVAAFAGPAQAKWFEASSDNFVVYADDSEKDIRRFSENLERFHAAMEYISGRDLDVPSPSNRVTIFVVGNQRQVQRLLGGNSRNVAGFYVPRAGGSKAFVQDIRFERGYPHFSTVILLHEYAHHFIMSSQRIALPRWANEGAAEFYSATSFNRDGGMWVGRPARHRAAELAYADDVSLEELFDYDLYRERKSSRGDAFYGRSWLLYHYLIFSEERRGQLGGYLTAVAQGTPSPEAAEQVFGDIRTLSKELKAYQRSSRMSTLDITPDKIAIGPVVLRPLPRGEAEMMGVRMRSQRGVTREEALELLPEAREIAANFPSDAGVLSALAEAEHDAGNYAQAIAAADAALALDPARVNAHVQKGLSLYRLAQDAEEEQQAAAFKTAIGAFSKLNAIENDHPLPLIYYYRSFLEQGVTPPENARHALERASILAPFDHDLAFNTAMMQAREGKITLARAMLGPVAANPHGGGRARRAEQMLTALEEAAEGEPFFARRNAPRDSEEDKSGPAQKDPAEGEDTDDAPADN